MIEASDDVVTVFNSLSWGRNALVSLPAGLTAAQGLDGASLPVQKLGDETLAEVVVPSCGWTTLKPAEKPAAIKSALKASADSLENELICVQFNARGEITSILDKETGCELAAGPCNCLKMYKDVPGQWDAWDIDGNYTSFPFELTEDAKIEVVAEGPLVAILRVTRRLNNSLMVQTISLRRNSRRMDLRDKGRRVAGEAQAPQGGLPRQHLRP